VHRFVVLLLVVLVPLAALSAACEGCRAPSSQSPGGEPVGPATVRLYLLSDLAGALEPCGCVKDQLGGMDRLGALVKAEADRAKGARVLSAGPLFFMDMELSGDKRVQEIAKAETIATSLSTLGLAGFAPGRNDWAGGSETLARLREVSRAPIVAANLEAEGTPAVKSTMLEVEGLRLGVVGVAAPDKAKVPLEGVRSAEAAPAVRAAVDALKSEGAQAIVALAAVGRGEAKRIADACPELLAVVVGSTGGGGEANTEAAPAERVGEVLVVETANHLQTVAVLDLHLRDAPKGGLLKIADGTGIERIRKREELSRRVDELRVKIAVWENDGTVAKADIEARKKDLAKLEAEREALGNAPPPAQGSFYRYEMRDVREKLGSEETVRAQMLAYYKKVNEHNKVELADRKPRPPVKGEAGYVGVDVCSDCHEEAREVWDKTDHAHAYATLEKGFKEFNLDCVSCHVTGYDRPGGSTVTHNADLKNVQCEVCHGPGQLHAAKPDDVKIPVAKPGPDMCLSCHHPPHVHTFDARAKMNAILGPGHGRPL
jgi:hypothetical protein